MHNWRIEVKHVHMVPNRISAKKNLSAKFHISRKLLSRWELLLSCSQESNYDWWLCWGSLVSSSWPCHDGGECGAVRDWFGCLSFWTDRLFLHQTHSDWIAQNQDSHPSWSTEELKLRCVGISMVTFSSLGLTQDELTVTFHPPRLLFWLSLEATFYRVCFLPTAEAGCNWKGWRLKFSVWCSRKVRDFRSLCILNLLVILLKASANFSQIWQAIKFPQISYR